MTEAEWASRELTDTEMANRETGRSPSIGAHGYSMKVERPPNIEPWAWESAVEEVAGW